MSVATNLQALKNNLPEPVTLVAVSKTKPVATLMEAYHAGQRIFGENKVQEMVAKYEQMPKDIQWHMIGHLQRNKVKYMASFVSLIHGVDSLRLLQEIEKQGAKHQRFIECLLQIRIAKEETKFGLTPAEAEQLLFSPEVGNMKHLRIVGLMGMATFTDDQDQLREEFDSLSDLFDKWKEAHNLLHLSMGMSADYALAIGCGSNMVRVGSAIFGARNYS